MKILAIPATNSRNGLNRQLLGYAAHLLENGLVPNAEVDVIDLADFEMPIYSADREDEFGIPRPARQLYE